MAPTRSPAVRIPPSRGKRTAPSTCGLEEGTSIPLSKNLPSATHATLKALRRSSSVYSRATRCWDDAPNWDDSDAPPPVPALPFAVDKRFTESSPELSSPDVSPLTPEVQETLPPMLEARTYQPVLPTPSPSLGPASMRKRSSNVTTISMLLPRDEEDRLWSKLPPDQIQLSPSPPPMTPILNEKYSVADDDAYLNSGHGAQHMTSRSTESRPSATLSAPFECPSTDSHWRSNSIDKAFSHMRLGSDVTSTLLPQRFELLTQSYDLSDTPEDVLSADYRARLIDEYKDLAEPPAEQWKDDTTDSDAEATAHELKMVPAPLFWENRQKELYPHRTIHAQQKQSGKAARILGQDNSTPIRKHKKKVSLPKAPLHMILPDKHKRKSVSTDEQDDSPTTAALKQALALRLRSKKQKEVSDVEDSPRLFHGKPISKPMQDGPMPLQLPKIAYRDVEAKKPVLAPPSAPFAKPQSAWRSSAASASSEKTPKSSRGKRRKQEIEEEDPDPYGIAAQLSAQFPGSGFDAHSIESQHKSRNFLHAPKISSLFHRTPSPASDHSSVEKGHRRNKSSGGGSHTDKNLVSAFSPVEDEHKSMRPAIFDKALDVMRERDRDKRRKDLKSQIKFVGKVDPNKIGLDSVVQKKDKFGEGWI